MTKKLTCVIVDDDPQAIKLLTHLIDSGHHDLTISGSAHSVKAGLSLIEGKQPDVVFLDIMLGRETSFNLLEQLKQQSFQLIFTTGHNEYAIRAFQYAAVHYLLKPIAPKQLQEAIRRAKLPTPSQGYEALLEAIGNIAEQTEKKVALPTRNGMEFIEQQEIIYCAGSGNYTEVYLLNGEKRLISRPIGHLENILSPHDFCRVHKKYLVNLNEVAFLQRSKSPVLLMKTGDHVDVSPHYKGQLLEQLKNKVDFIQPPKK
jgi:two-component system LytT family response regulator